MESQLSWMGGFFEGEGCISFANGSTHITVSQCNPYVLLPFYHRYGGCFYYNLPQGNQKLPYYRWAINARDICIIFLQEISPYLSAKRAQAEVLLAYLYRDSERQRGYSLSKEQLLDRDSCTRQLVTLKHTPFYYEDLPSHVQECIQYNRYNEYRKMIDEIPPALHPEN